MGYLKPLFPSLATQLAKPGPLFPIGNPVNSHGFCRVRSQFEAHTSPDSSGKRQIFSTSSPVEFYRGFTRMRRICADLIRVNPRFHSNQSELFPALRQRQ